MTIFAHEKWVPIHYSAENGWTTLVDAAARRGTLFAVTVATTTPIRLLVLLEVKIYDPHL